MSKFVMLIVAGLFASLGAFAQDSSQPPSVAPSPTRNQMHGDRSQQRLKRLSKTLDLTDEQKEKIKPILQDEEKQLANLDSDNTLTPQQKHKKMREIRMASRAQMDDILTPEQKEKLPSRREHSGGRHHQKPGASTPPSSDQSVPQ